MNRRAGVDIIMDMVDNPEARFLILCARETEAGNPNAIRSAALAVRNWPALLELAVRHGLTGYLTLGTAARVLPDSARQVVQQRLRRSAVQTMLLDSELDRVTPLLVSAGIPALVLKGAAIASTLYPQRLLRPYTDVDLLVKPSDEAALFAVLSAAGFREMPDEQRDRWRTRYRSFHNIGSFQRKLVRADTGVLLELHTDSLQLGLTPRCEVGRWQRAIPMRDNNRLLMLCPDDQIVHLSVHAHKHGWERLIWLKDIDLLLRGAMTSLNWELIAKIARMEGVEASLWYSLFLARCIFDSPVPADAIDCIQPSRAIQCLYRCTWPISDIRKLRSKMRRRAVQFDPSQSLRGMLPGLFYMGRRRARMRALVTLFTQKLLTRHRSM